MSGNPPGGIVCPSCGSQENTVTDSRGNKSGALVRRRRSCLHCQERFTTYETRRDPAQVDRLYREARALASNLRALALALDAATG